MPKQELPAWSLDEFGAATGLPWPARPTARPSARARVVLLLVAAAALVGLFAVGLVLGVLNVSRSADALGRDDAALTELRRIRTLCLVSIPETMRRFGEGSMARADASARLAEYQKETASRWAVYQ